MTFTTETPIVVARARQPLALKIHLQSAQVREPASNEKWKWSAKPLKKLKIHKSLASMEDQSISSITRSLRSKPKRFRTNSQSCMPSCKEIGKTLIGMLSMRPLMSLTTEVSPSLTSHPQGVWSSITRTLWNRRRNSRASTKHLPLKATSIASTPRAISLSLQTARA